MYKTLCKCNQFFPGHLRLIVPEFFKVLITIVPGIPFFVELALVCMGSLALIVNLNYIFLDKTCPSPKSYTQRVYIRLKMKSKK